MKEYQHHIDIKGLCCAAPVIRLADEFKAIKPGVVVLVVSDKVSMMKDIPAWFRMTGHALIAQDEDGGLFRFWIRRGVT